MANEFNIKNGFISNNNSIVQGSLIATSISAITYYNLPTDIFSGGTVSGETFFTNGVTSNTISATTYLNLPLDSAVTGFTFNPGNYDLTIFNSDNTNITQNLSILSTDMTVTGGTYDINSGVVTFTNNSGGTFNISGFASGYTDTFTTGGTYSNGTTIFTKTNGETYSVSGYTDTFTTGGTYSNGTTIFTKTNGETYNVSGYTTPFTGGTVNSLTANTIEVTVGKVIVPTGVNSNEAVNKGQLESYTTTQLAGKMNNPSLTASYIPKALTSTSIGNSRLFDDGSFLGIGSVSPIALTKDIQLGRQANKEIGIEQSDSVTIGRDLTVTAGRTINFLESTTFLALNQTSRQWMGMGSNGTDMYVVVSQGDIYKQTGSAGNFLGLGQTARYWSGIAVAPNGNVYAVGGGGGANANSLMDIYMQSGGTGSFNALGQTARNWSSVCVTSNGDVYAAVGSNKDGITGDIYKQTGGSGSFVAMGQTLRTWMGLATNGVDVYATVLNGDIYKLTGGIGSFVGLGQTARGWNGICVTTNGDVYASVGFYGASGDIYKQTGGIGNFIALGQTIRSWNGLGTNGIDVYSSIFLGDIYKLTLNSLGTADLQGGKLKLNSGTGKGSGDSSIEMYTGQVLSAGTTMQTATLRAKIDNTGLMTLPSVTNALIDADTTGKAAVTKEYVNNRLVVETTTGYTLTNVDSGGIVIFKTMSAQTLNVPLLLADGFECTFVTLSGVTLTVPAVSGITLNNAIGTLLPPQSSFTLKRMIAPNTFIATGNL